MDVLDDDAVVAVLQIINARIQSGVIRIHETQRQTAVVLQVK